MRPLLAFVALAAGPLTLAAGVATPPAASRPVVSRAGPALTVTVAGHGLGHGRGMGQYGAYGYASEGRFRWSYQHIVGHYYGGTYLEGISAPSDRATISVDLSELDGATVTTVRPHRPGARLRVNGGIAKAGTLNVHHTGRVQDIRATAGDVSVDLPGVGWRTYDGIVQVQPAGAANGAGGQTWNVVRVEAYVAGVVPSESPAGWGATGGEAALQAQAVAARSYALAYVAAVGRICDTSACQNYGGAPSTVGLGGFATYSDAAVTSTAGEVMCTVAATPCPAAAIAATEYSASTGGWTAGGAFPPVADAGDAVDANPFHNWTTTVRVATVESLYPSIGAVRSMHVTSRNGYGANRGRALEVRITGTGRQWVDVSGATLAAELGLPSDWFRFVTQP